MRALRIVVVEDLEDTRVLVAELLEKQGHHVLCAHDGETAIELICAERPDVALVDIGLPNKDGYEVAREVRRVLQEGAPRMIAVTGYAQQTDRAAASAAGFDAHVSKPATVRELFAALADL